VAANDRITTAAQAANDPTVLAFGWLQGAANRLEYILGHAIADEFGISHAMFEVLLILGRAGRPGMSMRALGQERVLTTGGITRLVDRMEDAGLVTRTDNPGDRRGRLVHLTAQGEKTVVRAAQRHVQNVQRYLLDPLPAGRREQFARDLRTLSLAAREALPRLD